MNQALFEKLKRFYEGFDKHLLKVEGNVCKACQCNECCTFAAKGGKHAVSKLELDYIEEFYRESGYPQGNVEQFQEYLSRKKNIGGELAHSICPFFNLEEQGCSIYSARPLSCRMYGSFFVEGFPIPTQCYFKDKGKNVRRGAFLEDVPLSLEFFELKAEHMGTRPVKITNQQSSPFLDRDLDDLPAFDMKTDPFIRACKLEQEGKFEEAVKSYEEARKKYPDWSFLPSCMGTDLLLLQRYPEAAEACAKAVAMRPDNAFYHFVFAMASELSNDIERAAKEYREATRLNPKNAIAFASLANILFNKGELDESLECYQKAISLDPDCKFYHFYCGVALLQLKRLGEAEHSLIKAIELDPELALAHLELAKIYQEQKKIGEAKAMWNRYLELSKAQAAPAS